MRPQPFPPLSLAACAGLLVFACAVRTSAKDGPSKDGKHAACSAPLASYKAATEREKERHWIEARELYLSCAQASACAGLATRCQMHADRLAATMPSIVPVVTNEDGSPKVDVQVRFDGKLLCSQLDGTSLPVDAGLHDLTFGTDQRVFAAQKILVVETQRNRLIPVTVGGPSAAPASPATETPVVVLQSGDRPPAESAKPTRAAAPMAVDPGPPATDSFADRPGGRWAWPRSPWAYVIGGAGLAALAGGGVLTVWGNRDNDSLRSHCRPDCLPSSLDHVRSLYVAADISYGIGAAALAVSTFLFATSRRQENPTAPRPMAIDVQTTPGGAFAAVTGAF